MILGEPGVEAEVGKTERQTGGQEISGATTGNGRRERPAGRDGEIQLVPTSNLCSKGARH